MYKLWNDYLPNLTKTTRTTLGEKICSLVIEILEITLTASYLDKKQKLPYVRKALSKMDLTKFFIQLAWEAKIINDKKFIVLLEKSSEIGRMLNGWSKQLAKENPAS